MKDYKIEVLVYTDSHIGKDSKKDIQDHLDRYTKNGYNLSSTDAVSNDGVVYIYLYFEKEIESS